MLRVLLFSFLLSFFLVHGRAGYDCFEDKCWCERKKADCRYNDDKLPYIPKLPAGITTVDFLSNEVKDIQSAEFFDNVTDITALKMISDKLTYIVPGAFDKLEHLQYLDLSFNDLRRLPENLFSRETRERLLRFDASQNRFHCSRDLIWLAEWKLARPSVFQDNIDQNYTCLYRGYRKRDMMKFVCEKYKVCGTDNSTTNADDNFNKNQKIILDVVLVSVGVVICVLWGCVCFLLCSRRGKGESDDKALLI